MCSWRSKGSINSKSSAAKVFVLLLAVFLFCLPATGGLGAQNPEETHTAVTVDIAVTLAGITAFSDFQELRAGLFKSEGISKVLLVSEAPGLISFKVTYAGEAVSLIEKLSAFFPKKYDIKEKRLPSGGTEVSISRREGV